MAWPPSDPWSARPAAGGDLENLSSGADLRDVRAAVRRHEAAIGELKRAQRELAASFGQHRRMLRSLQVSSPIQKLTDTVHSAHVAAYGQKGSVFKTNNLLLAGNQVFWSFVEPLLRGLDVPLELRSIATWLAPLGSLATAHLALGDRQHIRFVSGIATLEAGVPFVVESLRERIAESLWPSFQRRTNVPVTAAPILEEELFEAIALVQSGLLMIGTIPLESDVEVGTQLELATRGVVLGGQFSKTRRRVAWMVDTGEDVG